MKSKNSLYSSLSGTAVHIEYIYMNERDIA